MLLVTDSVGIRFDYGFMYQAPFGNIPNAREPSNIVNFKFDQLISAKINEHRKGAFQPSPPGTNPIILVMSTICRIYLALDFLATMDLDQTVERSNS